MLRAQRLLPKLPARVQRAVIRACGRKRFVDWAFGHYLRIAPPEFERDARRSAATRRRLARRASTAVAQRGRDRDPLTDDQIGAGEQQRDSRHPAEP